MTEDQEFSAALELLERVPRPPEGQPCVGATPEQLEALDESLGYRAPDSVRTWLGLCNGVIAGPGGLYGWATPAEFLDIPFVLAMHPLWRDRRWLPVAGDGTGNHYVVDASRSHFATDGVFFIDVSEDRSELAYVTASTLSRFLVFLLERELRTTGWPFDPDSVLARDPEIGLVSPQSLLPWS